MTPQSSGVGSFPAPEYILMKYATIALVPMIALLAVFSGNKETLPVSDQQSYRSAKRTLRTHSTHLDVQKASIGERVEAIHQPEKASQDALHSPDTSVVSNSLGTAAQDTTQLSTSPTVTGDHTIFSTQRAPKVLSTSATSNSREAQELRVTVGAVSTVVQKPTDLPMHAPAVWVEIPDSPHLTQHQQIQIQLDAEKLIQTITEPDSEKDLHHDALAILASDADFRRMYGQHAWMQHHIQAHHLGLIPNKSGKP